MKDSISASKASPHRHNGPDRTFLTGLIGMNIQKSRSPAMHEMEADALGLRCLYKLVDLAVMRRGVDALSQLLDSAELMGFSGLNITHPCKQAVIPLLHELSEEARTIGAVNTVHFVDGKRYGYNTDAIGFSQSFTRGLPGACIHNVVQIGAGGAGAATAYAILKLGARHLTIVDANSNRATALMEKLSEVFAPDRLSTADNADAPLQAADGLIHATPTGMREHPGLPVNAASLRSALWVAEIVYFPLETELLRGARAAGCRVLDGGGMAVFQAASALEIFTGHQVDRDRMLDSFNNLEP